MLPYIGITDFTHPDEVRAMYRVFETLFPHRLLHVGVMMSFKTLHGIRNRWQNVFSPKEDIANTFSSGCPVYNCLHYADYTQHDGLPDTLARAISYGGKDIHALQLDMIWPDAQEILKGIQQSGRKIEIILQIGASALELVGDTPRGVVERLSEYSGIISRVLLDRSMGRGLGMDGVGLLPFVEAIQEAFPDLGIAVAGGLGPKTIHLLLPLSHHFPQLSIDAQGRLRPSGRMEDPIDWKMAESYLINAHQILTSPGR